MRILILNWKDINHPDAGGAERVTHELAKQLVNFGHSVTIFTSCAPGLSVHDSHDGVKIIRRGKIWSVHLIALWYYIFKLRGHTDVVIDQIHGIPFFTPLYVRKPILAWIHEVAGDIWKWEFRFPVAFIGAVIETLYFKMYQSIPFMTHTPSTRNDLVRKGIPYHQITILAHTINTSKKIKIFLPKNPLLIYIGRLTPMKRIELLLFAVSELKSLYQKLQVRIIGRGKKQYIHHLKNLALKLQLGGTVHFLGQVSEAMKYELLTTSSLNIQPSLKEGFGLTVLEAASRGTPTVAYDVGGLRDIIKNGKTGIIVNKQTPQALAAAIAGLLNNSKSLMLLSRRAFNWSKSLPTWQKQARKLEQFLQLTVAAKK